MRVVLGVPRLVEEGVPVVGPSDRLDDEHHAAGNLDRRAEGARRLGRPRLDVQVDVLLGPKVDPEPCERGLERRQHRVRPEAGVPLGRSEEPGDVPTLRLLERDAHAPNEPVERGDVEILRLREEAFALTGERVQREPKRAYRSRYVWAPSSIPLARFSARGR